MVDAEAARKHIVSELGMAVRTQGDGLRGDATIVAEMHVPGTECLRASILATWTDVLSGLLVSRVVSPRVPVTLELDVQLYEPPRDLHRVEGVARTLKAGRSVVVASVDWTSDGRPLGIGTASFMASPDATLTLPNAIDNAVANHPGGTRLTRPFAERAGCERRAPGVAALVRSDDALNASNTINGGLIALVVEEAALSLAPGTTLASLAMRYLRPARVGPVVGAAAAHAGVAQVEVRDAGSDDRLAVVATTRTF